MCSIENIEIRQNIKLPNKYKELHLSNFKELEKYSEIYMGDEKIVITKFLNANEISSVIDEFYDYFGYDIIPIAITEYDNYICFYYNAQTPSVIYWNYELAMGNPEEAITYLCKDFDEFVSILC